MSELRETCDYLMIPFNEKTVRTQNICETLSNIAQSTVHYVCNNINIAQSTVHYVCNNINIAQSTVHYVCNNINIAQSTVHYVCNWRVGASQPSRPTGTIYIIHVAELQCTVYTYSS